MEALYFPHLSLPAASWTYPNILFFDKICVIAPNADWRELFDGPTRVLLEHDLVRTLDPLSFPMNEQSQSAVLSFIVGSSQKTRKDQSISRIHLGKLRWSRLADDLAQCGLLWPSDHPEWFEGFNWVIDTLMSAIATNIISDQPDISLVTDSRSSARLVSGVPTFRSTSMARRVQAVTTLLPIGPDANLSDILRFRERHMPELRQFRGFVETLLLRSGDGPNSQPNFDSRLLQAERLRSHLVGELSRLGNGVSKLNISILIGSVAAPLIESSFYSAMAGTLGLGYALYSSARDVRARRQVLSDKLVFAALASQAFSPRRADDILR